MKYGFDLTLVLDPHVASDLFNKCYSLGVSIERFLEIVVEDMACIESNNHDKKLIDEYLTEHTPFCEDDLSFSIWCVRNFYGARLLSCFDSEFSLVDQDTLHELYDTYTEENTDIEAFDSAIEDARNYVKFFNEFMFNKNRS